MGKCNVTRLTSDFNFTKVSSFDRRFTNFVGYLNCTIKQKIISNPDRRTTLTGSYKLCMFVSSPIVNTNIFVGLSET